MKYIEKIHRNNLNCAYNNKLMQTVRKYNINNVQVRLQSGIESELIHYKHLKIMCQSNMRKMREKFQITTKRFLHIYKEQCSIVKWGQF